MKKGNDYKLRRPVHQTLSIQLDFPMDSGMYSVQWAENLNVSDEVKEVAKSIIINQEKMYMELGRKHKLGKISALICATLWRLAQHGSTKVHMSIRDVEKWCDCGKETAIKLRKDFMKMLGARRIKGSKSYRHNKYNEPWKADGFNIKKLEGNGGVNVLYRKGVLAHRNAFWNGIFSLDDRFLLSLMQQGVDPKKFLKRCGYSDNAYYWKMTRVREFMDEYVKYMETGDDSILMKWGNESKEKGDKKLKRIYRERCAHREWVQKKGEGGCEIEETEDYILFKSQSMRDEYYQRKHRAFLASRREKYKAKSQQEYAMWSQILHHNRMWIPDVPAKSKQKDAWLYRWVINDTPPEVSETASIALSIRNGLYAEGIYDTPGEVIGQCACEIFRLMNNDVDDILDVMGWDEMHYSSTHMLELARSLP